MGLFRDFYHFARRAQYILKGIIGWPLVGEIDGRFIFSPPRLLTDEFGDTSFTPSVLEIMVDNNRVAGIDAGVLAKQTLFAHTPPLVFNVCFACARPSLLYGGDYANPASHWFNVFFGFYEIDVDKELWGRPFGFDGTEAKQLHFDDLLRIGKADWNFFSNFIYGVPEAECKACCEVPGDAVVRVINPAVKIGKHEYVEAEAENVTVVSGYVSGRDKKRLKYNDRFWSAVWRTVFGRPKKTPAFENSFIPTRMKMRFYIRFEEDFDYDLNTQAYKTYIYGGSVNLDYSGPVNLEQFLEAQMAGVRDAAAGEYFHKRPDARKIAFWKRPRKAG